MGHLGIKHHALLSGIVVILIFLGLSGPAAAKTDIPADRFEWFNDAKAGMFIHWGPYSITGGDWKGQDGTRDAHLMHEFRIPLAEYKQLAATFNPVEFDADEWVKLAKDAGLRYIVYVSKHHDGFAMFNSPSSDYDMVDATAFGRDPLKELAAACHKQGLVLCVYYSLGRDWSVPGIPVRKKRCNDWDFPHPPADAEEQYIENKVKPQLTELLTQYGPIGAVWFDTPEKITAEHSQQLRDLILSIQPDCLINARIGHGKGDYDIHEQRIPAEAIKRPWETCLTINGNWGYNRHNHNWKSPEMLVRCLVDVASKGGNFLINIGPTGDGIVPAPSVDRLHALGDWLRINGESIYGTTASQLARDEGDGMVFSEINPDGSETHPDAAHTSHQVNLPLGWRSTSKPGCLYIHLFGRPQDGVVRLQGLPEKVQEVTMLADPQRKPLKFEQEDGDFCVSLPDDIWDQQATVLKLVTVGND